MLSYTTSKEFLKKKKNLVLSLLPEMEQTTKYIFPVITHSDFWLYLLWLNVFVHLLDIYLPYIAYFLKQYCLKYKSKLKTGKLVIYSNMNLQHSKVKLEFLNLSVTYIILSPQGKNNLHTFVFVY